MDKAAETSLVKSANPLLPIFVKLEQMKVLLVGAGNIGLEKLKTIKHNAPNTAVKVVAKEYSAPFKEYASSCGNVELVIDHYSPSYLADADLIFAAVNDHGLSAEIFSDSQRIGKLCNCADKPELCHFYLASVATKGDLKIAISTNGKSPTIAKRLKEVFQEALPNELEDVISNMHVIRQRMTGNFNQKVEDLNRLTRMIVEQKVDINTALSEKKDKKLSKKLFISAAAVLILLIAIFAFINSLDPSKINLTSLTADLDYGWISIMFFTGFTAQLVDGMLGMGFGVISTTVLLTAGVNPAIVSSRVHSTRVFSSGLSGYSHHKLGNVNMDLFKALAIPGCIGALIGATLACVAGDEHAHWIRPLLSVYTLYLGIRIFYKAFGRQRKAQGFSRPGWLATAGGMLDAFAGGGWGSLVTGTLISKSSDPVKVIGSVCLAEFFVMLVSAVTFFVLLEGTPFLDIAAMILGGLLAAPLSASLAGKLPSKYLYLLIGGLVIGSSLRILIKAILSRI